MQSRKLPNELSTEDLLLVVDNNPTESNNILPDNILGFLSFYNITPGTNSVRVSLLYQLHCAWSKNPTSLINFGKQISNYLPADESKTRSRSYFINLEALNLSKRAYELLSKREIKKTKSPNYQKHFDNFLKAHNFAKGENWTESYLLYYLYDKWAYKIKKSRSLSKNQFYKFCKINFECKRTKLTTWFAINTLITEYLSEEHIMQIRESNEKTRNKKESEDNKSKVEGKVSSTTPGTES